jgi:hypothetical protein
MRFDLPAKIGFSSRAAAVFFAAEGYAIEREFEDVAAIVDAAHTFPL